MFTILFNFFPRLLLTRLLLLSLLLDCYYYRQIKGRSESVYATQLRPRHDATRRPLTFSSVFIGSRFTHDHARARAVSHDDLSSVSTHTDAVLELLITFVTGGTCLVALIASVQSKERSTILIDYAKLHRIVITHKIREIAD